MAHRITIIWLTLAVIAAACGGSGSTPTETEAKITTTQAPADTSETATTQAIPTTQAAAPATEGAARVAVGDLTWDFTLNADARGQCLSDAGGTFFVVMFNQDGNGDETVLNITAQRDGRVVVQAGSPLISSGLWISDEAIYTNFPDLEPGVTADVSIDGNTITGTATFYEDRSLRETLQTGEPYATGLRKGTFTAICPAS